MFSFFASKRVVLLASLVVFLAFAARFFDHTTDDAFISFRYAEHLAQGHGPVYNPGERVEGYTNFLWVVLLAPFLALQADPELASGVLGLAASGVLLAGVVRFSPSCSTAPEVVWIAPLLCASSPVLGVWATGGLEGPLFTCLLLWAAGLTCEGIRRGRLRYDAALLAALAAITRPEGVALAAVLLVAAAARIRPTPAEIFRWCAVFLASFLPYFFWRWSYYGDLLPNTFYAKVGLSGAQALRGLRYVGAFLRESGYVPLLPLFGLFWLRRETTPWILGLLSTMLAASVVFVGGDSLPMFRFLLPVLPFLYLLGAWGTLGVLRAAGGGRAARAVALALVVACCVRSALPAFRGEAAELVDVDRQEVAAWKEVGLYFAEHGAPDESIAVITAGAIPFFSKLEAIDMLGLNDRTIAHRAMGALGTGAAGHEKYDVDYVLDRAPTYVVIGTYGICPDPRPVEQILRPFYPAEIELLRSHRFNREYVAMRAHSASGYFVYFVRRDATRRS